MTTDSHQGRMDALEDLSAIPDDVLHNYWTLIREDDEPDPDAQFARRMEAIFWLREHNRRQGGRDFLGSYNNVRAEILRRRGEELPLELRQVYDWNGVTFTVVRMSRDPYNPKPWADIHCTGPGGATWKKRQPLPLPPGSKLIGWQPR